MELKYFSKTSPFYQMSQRERDSAKEKIFRSAKYLFLKNGYSKTTTREITAHADVSHGLITYYYKTKENIFKRFAREIFAKIDHLLTGYGKCMDDACFIATFFTLISIIMDRNPHFCDVMYEVSRTNFFEELAPGTFGEEPFIESIRKNSANLYRRGYEPEIAEKMAYFMLVSATRIFTRKVYEGNLNLSFEELPKYMLGMIFPAIGMRREETEQAILEGERKAKKILMECPDALNDEYFL